MFRGEPSDLRSLVGIVKSAVALNPRGIIQLGLLLLMRTGLVSFGQGLYFGLGGYAAGLAANGMKPVCAIYSTFLQRGYDQLIHDVALHPRDGATAAPPHHAR